MSAAIHEDADLSRDEIRQRAATAAMQASTGLAELTLVAADGPQSDQLWADGDAVRLLLDGARMAIELERDHDGSIDATRDQVLGAIHRYLEGWE